MWICSVGNYGGDGIIWVNSRLCEQGDIAGQSFRGGWIGLHGKVIVWMIAWGYNCPQLGFVYQFLYLHHQPPTRVYVLTALWGEAAAHTDPEGELRDQHELASYTEKENPLIIVEVQASERIPQSRESNLVRQGAV